MKLYLITKVNNVIFVAETNKEVRSVKKLKIHLFKTNLLFATIIGSSKQKQY